MSGRTTAGSAPVGIEELSRPPHLCRGRAAIGQQHGIGRASVGPWEGHQ